MTTALHYRAGRRASKNCSHLLAQAFLLATLLALLPAPVVSQGDSTTVQVVRVIEGDTIQVWNVFGDRVTVRYIGINTPEIHHPMKGIEPFGKEASEANRKLVDAKDERSERIALYCSTINTTGFQREFGCRGARRERATPTRTFSDGAGLSSGKGGDTAHFGPAV